MPFSYTSPGTLSPDTWRGDGCHVFDLVSRNSLSFQSAPSDVAATAGTLSAGPGSFGNAQPYRQPLILSLQLRTLAPGRCGLRSQTLITIQAPVQIDFDIGSGVQRIFLKSPLPAITSPVTLDGSTQPGFSGIPLIVLDGTSAGAAAGLTINGGDSTIRDLVIHGFQGSGIVLTGPGGNVVTGDYIGTDVTGTKAVANGQRGIEVDGSANNTIGGTAAGAGNVISANIWTGLLISGGSDNVIEGNKIGTDVSGTKPLGNEIFGIRLFSTTGNQIGGTSSGAGECHLRE